MAAGVCQWIKINLAKLKKKKNHNISLAFETIVLQLLLQMPFCKSNNPKISFPLYMIQQNQFVEPSACLFCYHFTPKARQEKQKGQ